MPTTVQAGAAAAAASALLLWKLRHFVQGYWIDRTYYPPPDPGRAERVAVVTGGNRGLGLGICRELAAAGYGTVVVACRDTEGPGRDAADGIRAVRPGVNVEVMKLDLSTIESADLFADEFLSRHRRLDALICNAGVAWLPRGADETCPDTGAERIFQVNYLGHYRLWGRFRSVLIDTASKMGVSPSGVGARVVSVSSGASKAATISWDGTDLSSFKYGQSKLAQIMASKHVQRTVPEGVDLKYASVTPGGVLTDALNSALDQSPWWMSAIFFVMKPLLWCLLRSPRVGAQTVVMAAVDPDIVGGEYYSNCYRKESKGKGGISNDHDAQKKLILLSDKLLGRVGKKKD